MRTGFAFGLGVVIGAVACWKAGGHYALARQASAIAGEYVGAARRLWGRATGSVLIFLAVVAGGILIMMFS